MAPGSRYVSVRQLAVFAIAAAVAACIVVGVSAARGRAAIGRRAGIVSLSPVLTDLLFAIGAGDQVIGVTPYCRLPAGVRRQQVGDLMRVNRELVTWLQPRAIVIQQQPTDALKRIEAEEGIEVVPFRVDTVADLLAAARRLDGVARAAGTPADRLRTDQVIEQITDGLDAVRKQVAGRYRPRVLLTISIDRPMAAGQGTFLDELIDAAGGANVVTGRGYVMLNEEQIRALAPQVVIDVADTLVHAPAEQIAARRGYWIQVLGLPASQADRIGVLPDASITIAGAHLARTAEQFARRIHPEAFGP